MKLSASIPSEINGFLNSLAEGFILPENKELFEFANEINRWMYRLYLSKGLNINNEEKRYFLSFWGEMHKTYQSIVLLTQRGLEEDSFTLLRRLYEMLFKVVAISKDSKNIEKLKESELYEFYKLNRKLERNEPGTEIFKEKKVNFNETTGCQKVTVTEWAKMADMEDVYNYQYFILCESSHAGYSSINSSIKKTTDEIRALLIPKYEHYKLITTEAISIIFQLIDVLMVKLDLKVDKIELENYKNKLNSFCNIT